MSDVTPEEWSANGLAALDHLDDLYYSGDGITVRDYRAATDAIRTALLAPPYDRLVAIEKAARRPVSDFAEPQDETDDPWGDRALAKWFDNLQAVLEGASA